ncbi:hypothetical protein [Gemmobacter sp. 24YEA27]|uniref:hypothetical protein n=1 Tax=Gemmobacter sp. 24YEA27 TaxID=3040672 RepID=UPI0024B37359|nr:hypothetical protein [Gemmobacter sp. 24YEA27]
MIFLADTAKAGTSHIPLFFGRVDDSGREGLQPIADVPRLYNNYGFATKNQAVPARLVNHVTAATLDGAAAGVADHPVTQAGLEICTRDRVKMGKSVV